MGFKFKKEYRKKNSSYTPINESRNNILLLKEIKEISLYINNKNKFRFNNQSSKIKKCAKNFHNSNIILLFFYIINFTLISFSYTSKKIKLRGLNYH